MVFKIMMPERTTGETNKGTDMKKKKWPLITACAIIALLVISYCFYNGILWFTNPSLSQFPVRGIDVSHHQGEIDWKRLSQENILFAFIKATEGGDFVDPRFAVNWAAALETDLRVGAYHFFRPEKTGREQARNFIRTVPKRDKALPPVLDVECPSASSETKRLAIRNNIAECLLLLEEHYGVTPIIYATSEAYETYLRGEFGRYPLWIRSIFTEPAIADGRDWVFWQFSNRGKLPGYAGRETFIDLNVFKGTREDFAHFGQQ